MRTRTRSELHFADTPLFINSFSAFGQARYSGVLAFTTGALASAGWPTANLAIYYPLWLPFAYPVKRFFWCTGGSVAGNVDMGIYNDRLELIASTGAIAQSGTNAPQYTSVDLLLQPGYYWLGISASGTTSTFFRTNSPAADNGRIIGLFQQASAHPLPASITPAAVTNAYTPLFGITRTASGF